MTTADSQATDSDGAQGLGRSAARGALVAFGGQFAKMAIQVCSLTILARLLSPHDYGLVAMVMAIVSVADMFRDFGLSAAAVQAKSLTRAQRDNLFWINSGIGLSLCLLVCASAPLVADFYGNADLVNVTRALSVTFVLNGLATQYRAGLNRGLRFGVLATADVAGSVIGLALAVVLARAGASYWSLVGQQLTQLSVMTIIVIRAAGWRPARPKRGVSMDGLLRFGWNLLGSQVITYLGRNVDSIIIGAWFGPASLGLYNRAYQLLMGPLGQVRAPTTTVALPVLAQLQVDAARYNRYVARGQIVMGYTLVAGLGLVVGAADLVTDVFLGGKWDGAAPILRLLAMAGAFQTLAYVGYWVYVSRNLTRDLRRYSLVETAISIACIATGSLWGVTGVAAGFALAPGITWPISIWWLSRRTTIPTRRLMWGAARILSVAAVVALTAFATEVALASASPLLALGACVLTSALAFAITVGAVPILRRDGREVLAFGREALARA